ncbi:MAG: hypothetical protein WED00_03655 [Aquisalimonadaceae bacterium]
MHSRLFASSLITLGCLLALTTVMLPGEAQWIRVEQARDEHVTTLGPDADGHLYAGTQSGRLWRLQGESDWQDVGGTLGAVAITVLAPDPGGLLVGTSDGLYRWQQGWQQLLGTGRISDVRSLAGEPDGRLIVATGSRVLILEDGHWGDTNIADAIGNSPVYRAMGQSTGEDHTLHAGTVGRGVWTRLAGETDWRHNSAGLPDTVNVFSLAEAGNGLLLAGTDQGLFWQAAPLQPWRRLDAGLGSRRVLDLARRERTDGTVLLAASDDGVYSVRLVERQQSLETQGRWQHIPAPPPGLDGPVSWIVPDTETVWISASSLYSLTRSRSGLWYAGLAAGGTMAFAGFYMIVTGRRRGHGHTSI